MIIKLPPELPPDPEFDVQYRRAPNRGFDLSENDTVIALKNAMGIAIALKVLSKHCLSMNTRVSWRPELSNS
jgi:hypothetical protein